MMNKFSLSFKILFFLIILFYISLFLINYHSCDVDKKFKVINDDLILNEKIKCNLTNDSMIRICLRNQDDNEIYLPYNSFLMKKFDVNIF
jgi:hypothetical protein